MTNLSIIENLKSNNWQEDSVQPFTEKVGNKASSYFSFKNKKETLLSFALFPDLKKIRFRIFDPITREVSWLEIGIDSNTDKIISKIIEKQNEITQPEAFGFYFEISGLGEVAILAWEQYEDDYR